MRILIITDAWYPQINGVVRTNDTITQILRDQGDLVEVLSPQGGWTVPAPSYPEIRLDLWPGPRVKRAITSFKPDAIHIATEGPIGLAARNFCVRRRLPFTTAYHTRFPEYLRPRFFIPESWSYRVLRWFHNAGTATMVATGSMERELAARGFLRLSRWSRGVDTAMFRPDRRNELTLDLPHPITLYVGRVAVEKNIEAFLAQDIPGTKVVVGDGPMRADLQQRYPKTVFAGYQTGATLAGYFAAADVFVFPSRTDTFGLVLLEALACGTPVAAYPVAGPIDVIGDAPVGHLSEDLGEAIKIALTVDTALCRPHAECYSWAASAAQFRRNLSPIEG